MLYFLSTELFRHKVEYLVSTLVLSKCRSWYAVTTLSLGLLTATLLLCSNFHPSPPVKHSLVRCRSIQNLIWSDNTHVKPWLGKISWTMPRPCRSCRHYYAPTLLLLRSSCSYHTHQVPSTLSLIKERSKDVIESWLGLAGYYMVL